MKRIGLLQILLWAMVAVTVTACQQNRYQTKEQKDKNGYSYTTVTNAPNKTRVYTLANGLKVYLSENRDEPRIMTMIATRAGSVNDPVETTGLAHYFEHMMFKGSDEFGTSDWASEKVLIDSLAILFDQHKATSDAAEKKAIYKQIDALSQRASKLAIANEYDKMCSAIGAKGTNAFTSYDVTAYINNIPSNELQKWIGLEYSRFKNPVLRLFHTELETVYEEFNMYQDMDQMRLNNTLMSHLFPKNPVGRDVIGYPEHLKNPSMNNIMEFYRTWYVPNNMAIILSGDLDFDQTIQLIDKQFGQLPAKELPKLESINEEPITQPIVKEIFGPETEQLQMAFRFGGYNSDDRKYVTLIDYILSNSAAGLIDLDLNQQQKVLKAMSTSQYFADYGMHLFIGIPRQGQSLDEVKGLLLGEIEKVKRGEFDDWMLEATINNLKLERIRQDEGEGRVYGILSQFIYQTDPAVAESWIDDLSKITKEELVRFANEHYKENYVAVYKRVGEAKDLVKVEKPEITPLSIDRENRSDFLTRFVAETTKPVAPVFVDYKSAIKEKPLSDKVTFNQIANTTNQLFELNYIAEMGSNHNQKLALAIKYLPYLGTDQYAPEAFKKELYKLGVSMWVNTTPNRSYVLLSGLDQNIEKGMELLEHLLANAKPDKDAYGKLVDGILKERADQKQNQNMIGQALRNWGKYGKESPFTNILSEEELRAIDPKELTDILHTFTHYPHRVYYYGPRAEQEIFALAEKNHKLPDQYLEIPAEKQFAEQETDRNRIFLTHYDKSQVDIYLYSKCEPFDIQTMIPARIFNEYYGGSMSSVVFQEIREARALAYSAFAQYMPPSRKDESFSIFGGVFTQADKMHDALGAMNGLLGTMISNENSFNLARESVIKSIETERIIKSNIFWTWINNKQLGIDYDIRKDYYEMAQKATIKDAQTFFDTHFKDRKYSYLLIGNKNNLDLKGLDKLGTVEELTLEQLFNY